MTLIVFTNFSALLVECLWKKNQLKISLLWCSPLRFRHALVHYSLSGMPGIFYHALLVEFSMLADMRGMAIAK